MKFVVLRGLFGLVEVAHGEGDAAAVVVDAGDADANVLVDMYLTGSGQPLLRHLRHVDEAVLVDTEVDEGAELGDVGDDAVVGCYFRHDLGAFLQFLTQRPSVFILCTSPR